MFLTVLFWRSTLSIDQVLLEHQSGKALLCYLGHARDSCTILCILTRIIWPKFPFLSFTDLLDHVFSALAHGDPHMLQKAPEFQLFWRSSQFTGNDMARGVFSWDKIGL